MLIENKRVAIIGGGPGGLTLAILLQQKGVRVKVYERDVTKNARLQGATLDLHYGSGLKAIEAAGRMDVFLSRYRPGAEKGRVIDTDGSIVYDEHNKTAPEEFNSEAFRPEIDRSDLRDILLDALQPDTVVWDSQFKTMSPVGDAWQLAFKNGTMVTADIVIGADGANSGIRPFVTPVKPSYAGLIIVQGNVENAATAAPGIHALLKGGKIYVHGDEHYLHISSKGDGSIDFYLSCKKEEDWVQSSGINFSDHQQVSAWFKEECPGWDGIWLELFENTGLPLLLRRQYCIPFDQTWEAQSTVTLLGDAAHIMPPSGEGVNLAMLDALELSECLTSEKMATLQTAIAAYEQPMRARAAEEAQASMEMKVWMHAEGALDKIVQMFG